MLFGDPTVVDDPMRALLPNALSDVPHDRVKRPHNAYNLFFMEQFPQVKANFPNLTGNEMSREIGKRWKDMTDDQQHPYREQAREIWSQFRSENPDYHYEKGRDQSVQRKHRTVDLGLDFNLLALCTGDARPNESQITGILNLFSAQMMAQFVLQNKDVTDAVTASVHGDSLFMFLGSKTDLLH
jgi:hypothetical protein